MSSRVARAVAASRGTTHSRDRLGTRGTHTDKVRAVRDLVPTGGGHSGRRVQRELDQPGRAQGHLASRVHTVEVQGGHVLLEREFGEHDVLFFRACQATSVSDQEAE